MTGTSLVGQSLSSAAKGLPSITYSLEMALVQPDFHRIRQALLITAICLGVVYAGVLVMQEVRYLHGYFGPQPDYVRQISPTAWSPPPPTLPTLQDLPPGLLDVSSRDRK